MNITNVLRFRSWILIFLRTSCSIQVWLRECFAVSSHLSEDCFASVWFRHSSFDASSACVSIILFSDGISCSSCWASRSARDFSIVAWVLLSSFVFCMVVSFAVVLESFSAVSVWRAARNGQWKEKWPSCFQLWNSMIGQFFRELPASSHLLQIISWLLWITLHHSSPILSEYGMDAEVSTIRIKRFLFSKPASSWSCLYFRRITWPLISP